MIAPSAKTGVGLLTKRNAGRLNEHARLRVLFWWRACCLVRLRLVAGVRRRRTKVVGKQKVFERRKLLRVIKDELTGVCL